LDWSSAELCHKRFGIPPFEVYGSSETGGVAWRERKSEAESWKPFPSVQLELDAASQTLRIRSPHLPSEEAFSSSDRARLLPNGSFELLGRADRIVKMEEKRISLEAIEQAFVESGLASEARVVLIEGERDELGAVVVASSKGKELLKGGKHPLNQALREAAAKRVERVGLPRRYRYVEALPSNAQGKSVQADLLALFAEAAS
jgi:acyl-coenzyme A synthetase/AMP-(fatty) acid ligase